MIRDYIHHQLHSISDQIEDLNRQERIISDARRQNDRQRRDGAEGRVKSIRTQLLDALPPAATYEFLDATQVASAQGLKTLWQEKNRDKVDCLRKLDDKWRGGSSYFKAIWESPAINLALLPAFSFLIKFTFTLAQPYISRDEQDFYIIDNPVRKDKIFGIPYMASTSWKGSLRATLWQIGYREEDKRIRHLFGNEKDTKDQENFRAGCLYFYPTFFTMKGLEIINPQLRETRAGDKPILFESVPEGTAGVFTLLYVPFDLISEANGETRKQVAEELRLVATGLQAMFRIYGFGAKTSSGFGLAREDIAGTMTIQADASPQGFSSFAQLISVSGELGS